MKKSGLPPIAWALTGLLVVAAFLITLGQQDTDSNPEVASYGPSGLSAFANLLKGGGVNVAVDQRSKPKLGQNDVAVLFQIVRPSGASMLRFGDEELEYRKQFFDRVKDGATGLIITLDSDFLTASRHTLNQEPGAQPASASSTDTANPHVVKNLITGETYRITNGRDTSTTADEPELDDNDASMTLWSEGAKNQPFLTSYRDGKGTVLVAQDGIGVTNRFIDKDDNAKAFASALKILSTGGKRIVFEEASFGNVREPGLLETVGPWANSAWDQLLFLGLVVVFTLGKRFGLAEDLRSPQRGARELLDGMADTFKRARSTNIALSTAWVRADADVRRLLKLPRDATRSERDRLIPAGLQNAMARLEAASHMERVSQDDALDLITRVQTEMDAFLGPHRAKMRSQAKLKA